MFRKILVPLDGCAFAERALGQAELLARAAGAHIRLVRVVPAPPGTPRGLSPREFKAVGTAEEYLAEVGVRMAQSEATVSSTVVYGSPAEAILEMVALWGADVVVMTTHARHPIAQWFRGGVAERVLAGSPVPVLLVGPGTSGASADSGGAPSRLVVALDGSVSDDPTLAAAKAVSMEMDAVCVLLRVTPWPSILIDGEGYPALLDSSAASKAEARHYLDGLAAALKPDLHVVIDVRAGYPVTAIAQAARDHEAAFVLMAHPVRRRGWAAIFGSPLAKLLRHVGAPLLLAPPLRQEPGADITERDERLAAPSSRPSNSRPALAGRRWAGGGALHAPCSQAPRPSEVSPAERLLQTLDAHVVAHSASLAEHRGFAEGLRDPVARSLVQQIAETKSHNHQLLQRIRASLSDSLYWTHSPHALPYSPCQPGSLAQDDIRRVRELVGRERELAAHSRALAKAYASISGGFDALLLQTLAIDSGQHQRMLGFILRRCQAVTGQTPASTARVAPEQEGRDFRVIGEVVEHATADIVTRSLEAAGEPVPLRPIER